MQKINRVKLLKFYFILVFFFSGLMSVEAQDRPNIFIILPDHLGYGDVEFKGNEKIVTPHLDQMAE